MRPSSARTNNSLSRGTRPAHSINEDRAPFTSTSQSINLKNKNQAWPDIAVNFSTEGSDFHGLRSPNNPNLQSNTFKDYRGRADRPVTFNETQSSPHMTSPTSGRFNLGSRDYSPHIKPNGREQYNIEYENNATTGPSESAGGGQRPNTQAKDYVKLEKEIIDLKNDIIGKMHNPKAAQRPVNKGGSRDSSSSSSSSEEANKPNPGRVTKKKVSYRDDVKGGGKQKDNSKIRIYDEEDVLVEEPEPNSTLTDTKLKEEEKIIEKNVEGLGRALKRREKKYVDLKTKFKEMKTILKSYVNKVIDLEDTLKKKEEQLNNSEVQRKNDQKKLQKSNDLILELKSREEALQKSEGNAIDSSVEYKSRYLEQKEELRKLHATLEETEETFTQKIHDLTHNNKELTAELEVAKGKELAWKEKNEGRYREIEALERELSTSKSLLERYEAERGERESQMKAIREELDKVRNEKDWLERKVEDNNKSRQDFESDLIKVKRKSEEEVKKILEDKDTELAIKKEKVKKLKEQVKEYEKIVNKGSEERKILDFEVEKVVGQKANVERELNKTKEDLKAAHKEIAGLKTNLDSLKSQFNETYETLRLESTRSDNTQGEIKKLSKQLKIAETKLALRDKEVEKNDEKTAKLNNEVKSLLEETTRSRDYIGKLEDRVGFLQMHQSEEIAKVESRIEEFYREIYLLREENKVLKASEVALAKDIEMISQERDIFRQDYKDMKQANKILEKELRSLNRNMKEVIDEKILEISHHSRGFSSAFDKDPKTEGHWRSTRYD